jgi:hypothetical protein
MFGTQALFGQTYYGRGGEVMNESVKKWTVGYVSPGDDFSPMWQSKDGQWIRIDDYIKVENELNQTKARALVTELKIDAVLSEARTCFSRQYAAEERALEAEAELAILKRRARIVAGAWRSIDPGLADNNTCDKVDEAAKLILETTKGA